MSRWRSVTGRRAGRRRGAPSAAKPSSTCGRASSGTTAPIGASSESLPSSTCCIAATVVTALVMEAIQTTVSGVIAASWSRPRRPKAPS